MKIEAALVAFSALAFFAGCGPSSEGMCKKLEALEAKSDKKDKDKEKKDPKEEHDKCVKEFDHIKEVSPDAYKQIGKCTDLGTMDTAAGCMLGVVLGDEKLKADSEKKSKEEEAARKKKEADTIAGWPSLKDKPFEGKVKSFSDGDAPIGFSITLADGFEPGDGKDENFARYELKQKDIFNTPSITIMPSMKGASLDDEVKTAEMIKQKVVKKEQKGDNFLIETQGDSGGLQIEYFAKSGDKVVKCSAFFLEDDSTKPSKDKIVAWIEKMCATLKVK
jgi:hypothetical protein